MTLLSNKTLTNSLNKNSYFRLATTFHAWQFVIFILIAAFLALGIVAICAIYGGFPISMHWRLGMVSMLPVEHSIVVVNR